MRKEDKISAKGIDITVKELTVGEVRHLMMDMVAQERARSKVGEKENPTEKDVQDGVTFVLDRGLIPEVGLSEILRMTNMTPSQLDLFTPTELEVIIQKCKELNPDFFVMNVRLRSIALSNISLR